jgi:hypothetical protein
MRRSIPTALDGSYFPLTLAGGLRASFADIASESLPDELTTLMCRLSANQGEQEHGPSPPKADRVDRRGQRRVA